VGELPFSILAEEGFDADTYVDLFDGGPTVEAPLAALRSVKAARWLRVQGADRATLPQPVIAVRPERSRFVAILTEAGAGLDADRLPAGLAVEGEPWLCTPLQGERS
jgi:arginine N-succinyltransferase